VVDRQKPQLIEVDGFFHRLHEAETEHAVKRTNAGGADFQIFVGIGDISLREIVLAGADPVTDDAGADHVCNELVFLAVPGK